LVQNILIEPLSLNDRLSSIDTETTHMKPLENIVWVPGVYEVYASIITETKYKLQKAEATTCHICGHKAKIP